jgi:hypothetical protein
MANFVTSLPGLPRPSGTEQESKMRVGEQDAKYLMGPSGNANVSPISRPRIPQTLSSRVATLPATKAMSNNPDGLIVFRTQDFVRIMDFQGSTKT